MLGSDAAGQRESQEGRKERVQRERAVGGEERMGGRMPRETQRVVREVKIGRGIIWRKEEARPGGGEAGSGKERGRGRQTEGARGGLVDT